MLYHRGETNERQTQDHFDDAKCTSVLSNFSQVRIVPFCAKFKHPSLFCPTDNIRKFIFVSEKFSFLINDCLHIHWGTVSWSTQSGSSFNLHIIYSPLKLFGDKHPSSSLTRKKSLITLTPGGWKQPPSRLTVALLPWLGAMTALDFWQREMSFSSGNTNRLVSL
jgi:hypothetical protein